MKRDNNACLVLACGLYTPIDLSGVIKDPDLDDCGIEFDSHITIFGSSDVINKNGMLSECRRILGNTKYETLIGVLKEDKKYPVLDVFDLDCFEGPEYDTLVLKMKENNKMYETLKTLWTGLEKLYEVGSDYEYVPHMTLAKLKPGRGERYIENTEHMNLVLADSKFGFEDLVISYPDSTDERKYKQYDLTGFHTIDRFFRIERLERELY